MSQSHRPAAFRSKPADEPTEFTDSDAIQGVLDAVDDGDCRDILEATCEGSLTVNEIADACDLAQSTAYRKVDILSDADLLDESLRIHQSGKHVSEYACGLDDLTLTIDTEDGISLSVSPAEADATASFGTSFATQGNVADD
jgi:DNA-binding transcriptional ArsR family regulator